MHRSNPSQQISPSIHSANQFSSFFSNKIKTLRLNLPLININSYSVPDKLPPTFSLFKPASFDEIKQLILSSPKSTCQSDPIPSNLLPHCIDHIVPIITRIVNLFLNTGSFLKEFKSAFVKPLLKTLNLSAAFSTNDHSILLNRLKKWFGVSSTVLSLICYLYSSLVDLKLLLLQMSNQNLIY